MDTTRSILRSYYAISGLYTLAASVIWGVNTLFLLDAGLDFFEVFVANAAYSAGTVAFEIPTGVVADTLGRRTSFLASVAVLSASTLAYVGLSRMGSGVVAFAAVSVLLGLGFTFYSGAVDAWVVDALEATGSDRQLDEVFARAQLITGAAMLVGTVGGGLLGQIDLAVPFLVRAGLLVVLLILAYRGMRDIGFQPRPLTVRALPAEMAATARNGIRADLGEGNLRLLAFQGLIVTGFLLWGFYAWQEYFLTLLGRDAIWVAGVVSALIAIALMVGNAIVERASKVCRKRSTLLLWAAAGMVVGALVVGLAGSFFVAVPALLVFMVAIGVNEPVRLAYLHESISSEHRATAVSVDSMVGGLGGVGGQLGLGALGRARSVGAGYVVGAGVLAVTLPVLYAIRRRGGPPDQIVGREAADATCAGIGLPSIATVDPQPVESVS